MKIAATLDKVNKGVDQLRKAGAEISLDGNKGRVEFKGCVASFEYSDNVLSVWIIDTPFFVSESFVEEKIREYFQ